MKKLEEFIKNLVFIVNQKGDIFIDCFGRPEDEHPNKAHWIELTQKFIDINPNCNRCGASKKLQLHHWTYENWGNESQDEVELLCSICHKQIHDLVYQALLSNELPYEGVDWVIYDYLEHDDVDISFYEYEHLMDDMFIDGIFEEILYRGEVLKSQKEFDAIVANQYTTDRRIVINAFGRSMIMYKYQDIPLNPLKVALQAKLLKYIVLKA
jgi:hypothetical protein